MRFLAILKASVVVLSLLIGAVFVAKGFGADIPFLKVDMFEGHELPAGALILVFGVLIAKFWVIELTDTESTDSAGKTTKTKNQRFRVPPP
jgi:hypothetical protein